MYDTKKPVIKPSGPSKRLCYMCRVNQFTSAINTNKRNSCPCARNQGIHKGTVPLILNLYKSSGFISFPLASRQQYLFDTYLLLYVQY